jgi:hypothetical protein
MPHCLKAEVSAFEEQYDRLKQIGFGEFTRIRLLDECRSLLYSALHHNFGPTIRNSLEKIERELETTKE